MNDICNYSVDLEERDSTQDCKRDTDSDSEDRCIFHLRDDELEEKNNKDIVDAVKNELRNGKNLVDLVGLKINRLDLSQFDWDDMSINGILLSHAEINEISMSNCDIPIVLDFSDSNIEKLEGRRSVFSSDLILDRIEAGLVDISNSTIEFDLTMRDGHVSGNFRAKSSKVKQVVLDNSNFEGVVELGGLESGNLHTYKTVFENGINLAGCSLDELHSHSTVFEGHSEFSRADIKKATHFPHSTFHEKPSFVLCTMGRDVDFKGVNFLKGATFQSSEIYKGDFRHITANGDLDFSSAKFLNGLTISSKSQTDYETAFDGRFHGQLDDLFANQMHANNKNINNLYFIGATFEESVTIREADITGDVNFRDANIKKDFNVAEILIEGDFSLDYIVISSRFQINGLECSEISMRLCQLECVCNWDDIKVESLESVGGEFEERFIVFGIEITDHMLIRAATLSNVVINESDIESLVFLSGKADEFHLHDVEIQTILDVSNSSFGNFHIQLSEESETWVSFSDTNINDGEIDISEEMNTFLDFRSTNLGDIDIETPEDGRELETSQFSKTNFQGFDFTKYRKYFVSHQWEFDSFDTLPERMLEEDVVSPAEDLDSDASIDTVEIGDPTRELTYTKAKKGARNIGDRRAVSEFLIKELRINRANKKEILQNEPLFLPSDPENHRRPNWKYIRSLGSYSKNLVLDYSSSYGEKPVKIAGWTVFSIIIPAAIYALTRGLRNSATQNTVSVENAGTINLISDSLYFSVVTFTTLGYGDFQPTGAITRTIASLEALAGVFLTGLFIYSLGKQVSR